MAADPGYLCFVEGTSGFGIAWFCDTDPRVVDGPSWNLTPYHHHAGHPNYPNNAVFTRVAWSGPFVAAAYLMPLLAGFTPRQLNGVDRYTRYPWLASVHTPVSAVMPGLRAETTLKEFTEFVTAGGGVVYTPEKPKVPRKRTKKAVPAPTVDTP